MLLGFGGLIHLESQHPQVRFQSQIKAFGGEMGAKETQVGKPRTAPEFLLREYDIVKSLGPSVFSRLFSGSAHLVDHTFEGHRRDQDGAKPHH